MTQTPNSTPYPTTPGQPDRHFFSDKAIQQYRDGLLTLPQLTRRLATILNTTPCDCLACSD